MQMANYIMTYCGLTVFVNRLKTNIAEIKLKILQLLMTVCFLNACMKLIQKILSVQVTQMAVCQLFRMAHQFG